MGNSFRYSAIEYTLTFEVENSGMIDRYYYNYLNIYEGRSLD